VYRLNSTDSPASVMRVVVHQRYLPKFLTGLAAGLATVQPTLTNNQPGDVLLTRVEEQYMELAHDSLAMQEYMYRITLVFLNYKP
jgi:hypothetical protein